MTARHTRRAVVALAGIATAALAPVAIGATKNGITPLSPKAGASVPAGKSPTFKLRVKGKGPVYIYVCRKPKRDNKGLICNRELIKKAKRKGSRATLKAPFFNYPGFWLNRPGTYYWQAHRIDCTSSLSDCAQEGPVVKIRVR